MSQSPPSKYSRKSSDWICIVGVVRQPQGRVRGRVRGRVTGTLVGVAGLRRGAANRLHSHLELPETNLARQVRVKQCPDCLDLVWCLQAHATF